MSIVRPQRRLPDRRIGFARQQFRRGLRDSIEAVKDENVTPAADIQRADVAGKGAGSGPHIDRARGRIPPASWQCMLEDLASMSVSRHR